jgi:hypothetical protein
MHAYLHKNDKIHAYPEQFRVLSKDELQPGMDGGTTFKSVCFNTALYLPWLASQCLKQGVVLRRGIANHITDAATMHHTGKRADLVINCTGLSSLKLGGVEDTALYPGTLLLRIGDHGHLLIFLPSVCRTRSDCGRPQRSGLYDFIFWHRRRTRGGMLCNEPCSRRWMHPWRMHAA